MRVTVLRELVVVRVAAGAGGVVREMWMEWHEKVRITYFEICSSSAVTEGAECGVVDVCGGPVIGLDVAKPPLHSATVIP